MHLHTVPRGDPRVYDMVCRADTVGVFQIESRAQMSMLPRLRPRTFYDLVIEVAIVRPGPIQGDMVHPYLRRRNGQEPVTFPSEALRAVLGRTLGVPLFQEQAMRVVMVAAGFTAERADQLRKAMAAWRKGDALAGFRDEILAGMRDRGYDRAFAERTFEQIKGFGEYGFPESHAASFALLVYVSAWLKRHHPAAFAAALLNSQPMGFYAPAQLVRDAQEHGVTVRPIDANFSDWDCTLESDGATERRSDEGKGGEGASPTPSSLRRSVAPSLEAGPSLACGPSTWGVGGPALRLGLRMVKGLRAADVARLVGERRRRGAFASVRQLRLRTGLPAAALRRLAEADALGSIGLCRREALWQVLGLADDDAPLFDQLDAQAGPPDGQADRDPSGLPEMPVGQEVMADYAVAGLSLKSHPVALVRAELDARRVTPAAGVRAAGHGRWVRAAGLVLVRQRPGTASGVVFVTLEDETGIVNLIVRPDVYDRYTQAARHGTLIEAQGVVERQGEVVHVMVKQMEDLTHLIDGLRSRSRDFH